ncbi:MAG: hypothetical protein QNK92_01095 [Amylibacter sp.]
MIGVVTLLFNVGGAFDYVMTQTQNEAYMVQFSEAELAYFYSFPAWVQGSWAIAVWGVLLGSLFWCSVARGQFGRLVFRL